MSGEGEEESMEESRWQSTHHFLVVWIVNLFNQWELLRAQLLVESRHLSKLKEMQIFLIHTLFKRFTRLCS